MVLLSTQKFDGSRQCVDARSPMVLLSTQRFDGSRQCVPASSDTLPAAGLCNTESSPQMVLGHAVLTAAHAAAQVAQSLGLLIGATVMEAKLAQTVAAVLMLTMMLVRTPACASARRQGCRAS